MFNSLPFSERASPRQGSREEFFIDELHTHRHSFRVLGDWTDRTTSEWRLLRRYQQPIDFSAVQKILDEYGIKYRQFKGRDMGGLVWRIQSEEVADRLAKELLSEFSQEEEECSSGIKSDSPPPQPGGPPVEAEDVWMPTGPEPEREPGEEG
ncbi:MAG TPA: hypothetical protein VH643_02980 [Gemmataceae bacterium]|jgi:hypothetical protein